MYRSVTQCNWLRTQGYPLKSVAKRHTLKINRCTGLARWGVGGLNRELGVTVGGLRRTPLMPSGTGASKSGRAAALWHAACLWRARERSRVRISALVLWVANACIGLYLLWTWRSHGGISQQSTKVTRFPVILIFAHPLFAAGGLGFWVAYLLTGLVVFAWSAFGTLSAAALLGFAMLTRWVTGRGGRHARGAEQHFPVFAVVSHGVVGMSTFVLVLITATIISRG